jgi:hypothetical protein
LISTLCDCGREKFVKQPSRYLSCYPRASISLAVLKSLLSSAYEAAAYHQSQINMWMIHWSINNTRVDPSADNLMVLGFKAMIPYDTDERRKYLNSIPRNTWHTTTTSIVGGQCSPSTSTLPPTSQATNKPGHQQAKPPTSQATNKPSTQKAVYVESIPKREKEVLDRQNEVRVCAGWRSRTSLNNWCLRC